MANLRYVGTFGVENQERKLFVRNIFRNVSSAKYTGSYLYNRNADIDIYISESDLESFKELVNLLGCSHYFTLYEHTTESKYNKPWVSAIYRIVLSERENDHIDVIVIKEGWYKDIEFANSILYKLYSYHTLPKKMRNIMMNTTINIAHILGKDAAKEYAYNSYSFALEYLKEDYLE